MMAPFKASNELHAKRIRYHLCTAKSLPSHELPIELPAKASSPYPLAAIGSGAHSRIFSTPEKLVFKRALPTSEAETALWRGYGIHRVCCLRAALYPNLQILIPDVTSHITKHNKDFWHDWADAFPLSSKGKALAPGNVVTMEQIPSLPLRVGESLLHLFQPSHPQLFAPSDSTNPHFLLRPYLGTHDPLQTSANQPITLRDLPISLDTMHSLGLDPMDYVCPMAQGLALVHWAARADGSGLEFVLGSAPLRDLPYHPADDFLKKMPKGKPVDTMHLSAVRKRQCHVWMLDFDKCLPMTLDKAGCQKAARAHWDNEPFLPRPVFNNRNNRADEELWEAFADAYLEMGRRICGPESLLPMLYLDAVVQEGLYRSDHDLDEFEDDMESSLAHSLMTTGMLAESKELEWSSRPSSSALVTWGCDDSGACKEAEPQFWKKR